MKTAEQQSLLIKRLFEAAFILLVSTAFTFNLLVDAETRYLNIFLCTLHKNMLNTLKIGK